MQPTDWTGMLLPAGRHPPTMVASSCSLSPATSRHCPPAASVAAFSLAVLASGLITQLYTMWLTTWGLCQVRGASAK